MSTGIFGLLMQPPSAEKTATRFHEWQGASGRWWLTIVQPLLADHLNLPSVYVMVRRDFHGRTYPLYIGQTSDTGRRMDEHLRGKLREAIALGGNELHQHFSAGSERERFALETDLRNGHNAPLNRQNSAAVFGGLFGLGANYQNQQHQKSLLGQFVG
ncbi:GIY-YIG nuclease family protein [Rhizobium ruizarguesonis]|uniref:GIY-YIG nuclease family protein n=1 Tax=Rhizobium ruizarguesonis TaxID=2081791 RepID=UPI0010320067|nr:GIY-YIG nuclease family protein [Rhizobium ruizarguesonis]TBB12457.1 GIY-YIG nuclease family protein [Rhizobium ruizarguesonis]